MALKTTLGRESNDAHELIRVQDIKTVLNPTSDSDLRRQMREYIFCVLVAELPDPVLILGETNRPRRYSDGLACNHALSESKLSIRNSDMTFSLSRQL